MVGSSRRAALARAVVAFGLVALAACSADSPNVNAPPSSANLAAVGDPDDLGPARAAQVKHQGRLMQDRDILGTAIGRLNDGRPEITVLARNASAGARMPRELDGIPVTVEVTGDITILPQVANAGPRAKPGGGGGGSIQPTDYRRPAYAGMSTGNSNECAAGTIGAKINKGGTMYALSNNHVFARENAAGGAAEKIYQPGRYDLGCGSGSQYEWATLSTYRPISFSGNNNADAALAKLNNPDDLNGSPPPNGYGTVNATVATAAVNVPVAKYGRTTGLTTGVITGVDVTIRVQYTAGVATFTDQIQIRGDKGSFSRAGDSGSLIVRRSDNRPVGLLFAGGQTSTFANTIQNALSAVGGGTIVP